jgi:dipeptidyl aminopeptidase/acylaminoacyl peptidase
MRFLAYLALVAGVVALLAALVVWVPRAAHRGVKNLAEQIVSGIGPEGYSDCGRIGDGAPAFSPDGTELAFARCEENGTLTIRAIPAGGGESRALFEWDGVDGSEQRIEELTWAADGRLGFVTGIGQPSSIRAWDPATGDVRAVVRAEVGVKSGMAWSPEGRRLVYVRDSMLVVADDRSGRTLHELGRAGLDGRPAWSADGSKLVVESDSDLWLVDADGREPRHRLRPYAWCPATWIARDRVAHVDPTDPHHLVVLTSSGNVVRRTPLPTSPKLGACPDATARGARRFAFVDDGITEHAPSRIWLVDVDEAAMHQLADVG